MKLVKIDSNTNVIKQELIDYLLEAIEDLKIGKIDEFIMGRVDSKGTVTTHQFGASADFRASLLKRIGLLEVIKLDLMDDYNG
jgi:hypothetical protein